MSRRQIAGVVLDIEGTVAPIAYVAQTLFPFARAALSEFLQRRWHDPAVAAACQQVAKDAGSPTLQHWSQTDDILRQRQLLLEHLGQLMEADIKATGLKALQGLIWEEGYREGRLKSEIYPDVPPTLRHWHAEGLRLVIYSSGSVAAQKVFFAHSDAGDLTTLLSGYFDTTTGPKKEAESYRRIAQELKIDAGDLLFFSDVVAELDAAEEAGMQTRLVVRPGNAPVTAEHGHETIHSFNDGVRQ
jgi:enolase-phosphatase E1